MLGKRKRISGYKKGRKRYKGSATATQAAKAVVRRYPGLIRSAGYFGRYGLQASALGTKPELKFFDTALTFSFDTTGEVATTAILGQLSLIPQGDTESTRDGRKAVIKSIQLRGSLYFVPGSDVNGIDNTYLYLVLDTQANGAAAAVTDIFTSNVMATNMLNLNNSGRFRIIKKWFMGWAATAGVTTAYGALCRPLEYYKRCNIPIDWSGATGALTEIRSNNIFLAYGSTFTDDQVSFVGHARLRFMG